MMEDSRSRSTSGEIFTNSQDNNFSSQSQRPLMNSSSSQPIYDRYQHYLPPPTSGSSSYSSSPPTAPPLDTPASSPTDSPEGPPLCCFDHCIEHRFCDQKLLCFRFKSKFHRIVWISMVLILLCLLFALIVPLVFYTLEIDGIHDEIVIDSEHAASYNLWQSNFYGHGEKRPIYYDLYIFDVQNPVSALRGEKPILVQRGPYAFMNYFNKFDIQWSHDGDTVQYRLQTFYIFNVERTGPGLSPTDNVTLGYPSGLGFEYLLQQIPISAQELLDAALTTKINEKLDAIDEIIQTRIQAVIDNPFMDPVTKNETLTKLYHLDTLINVIEVGIDEYIAAAPAASTLLKLLLCTSMPDRGVSLFWVTNPVDAYFGYLNDPLKVEVQKLIDYLNMTDEAPWDTSVPGATTNYTSEADATRRRDIIIQKTGKKNMKEAGKFIKANNQTTQYVCVYPMDSQSEDTYEEGKEFPFCEPFQLEWTQEEAESKGYILVFGSDYANRIAGTDANQFGAPANTEKLQVYVNDIYRTSYLKYQKDVEDWHGVRLRRYVVQNKDAENITQNPSEAWQYNQYGPSGLQNLTTVATLPFFLSKPHFLDADPSLLAAVVGLSPNREIHDTTLDIEPNTGALCRVQNRAQVIYQMNSMYIPQISAVTAAAIHELCTSLSNTTAKCDGLDVILSCLAIPTEWNVYQDRVYVPYAWIDQYSTASESDAHAIKNGLYTIDNYANQIRLWCYISAGLLAMMVVGLYVGKYIVTTEDYYAKRHLYMSVGQALE